MTAPCAHLYARRRWWWLRRNQRADRWECVGCGFRTRTYDSADRWAGRPAHRHMTVALPGVNTAPRTPSMAGEWLIVALFAVLVVLGVLHGAWLGLLAAVVYGWAALDLARHVLRLRRLRREADREHP